MNDNLFVNEVIEWNAIDGKKITERILWLDEYEDIAYTIDIYSDKGLPTLRKISEIRDELQNNTVVKLKEDPFIRYIKEEEIKPKYKDLRDRAWNIISKIVESSNEPSIYEKHKRGELINKTIEDNKVTYRIVYKYLRKYWQRGKTKNALLPDYYNSGGKGKSKTVGKRKLGRPRKIGTGINVDENTKKIFRVAINRYYLNSNQNPLTTAYDFMIKDFYAEDYKFEDGVKKPILIDYDDIPSFTQFKYWYEKEQNIKKVISLRKGSKKFELNHRAVLGKSDTYVRGPGSKFQIDATIGDVYLVSRYNRKWIIGRPVIYAVIDVFSRMISGIYVGLEGPSWIGCMMALENATANKVNFCSEYNMNINEELWPCHYMPEEIIGDRGELESKNSENIINAFQVRIDNTPPYRADWKGIIEQYFHTINGYVKPLVPGTIHIDFRERGGKDYRLDAKLDLYQFTQIIIKCALFHNNQHWLEYYDRNETLIEDEVEPIPLKLWDWGIKNRSGRLRSFPEDIIKLNLMPSNYALVTTKGIKFKYFYYSCENAVKEMWFEKARNRGSWKVNISYDPRNMNNIYIRSEDGRNFEKCFLLESQTRYFNKTLDEIEYLIAYERLNRSEDKKRELQQKVDLLSDVENIVNNAEKTTNSVQDKDESKAAKIKNIRENRKNEKMLNRDKEAFVLGQNTTNEKGKVLDTKGILQKEDNDYANDLELLERMQKERLYGSRNK